MDKKHQGVQLELFGKITALFLTGVFSISGILISVIGALISENSVAIAANRPTTMSTNGMVTTPHYLASQAA